MHSGALPIILVLLGVLAGCGHSKTTCKNDAECDNGSVCIQGACASKCATTFDCANNGQCSDDGKGNCTVGSDADCRQSILCGSFGLCTDVGGRCQAKSDSDCVASDYCKTIGTCAARDGRCVSDAAGCKRLPACRERGACSPVENGSTCGVLTDQDCKDCADCQRAGRLHAKDGKCVLGDEECRASPDCLDYGRCFAKGINCVVKTDADCLASEECASGRACAADATDERDCKKVGHHCKDSPACTRDGRCGGDDLCSPTEASCKQSEICKTAGKCNLVAEPDGSAAECAKDCADSTLCRQAGNCTPKGDHGCVVGSDADCHKSDRCRRDHQCMAQDGWCVIGPSDCRDYQYCASMGLCSSVLDATTRVNVCGAASDADCAQSDYCFLLGQCSAQDHQCVVSDEGCRKTELCRTQGACSAMPNNACGAKTDEECKTSNACRGIGMCRADGKGSCVK